MNKWYIVIGLFVFAWFMCLGLYSDHIQKSLEAKKDTEILNYAFEAGRRNALCSTLKSLDPNSPLLTQPQCSDYVSFDVWYKIHGKELQTDMGD